MLYQDTLAPKAVSTQEELEAQYLTEFYGADDSYYIDFNINAKLQGSFLEQARIVRVCSLFEWESGLLPRASGARGGRAVAASCPVPLVRNK